MPRHRRFHQDWAVHHVMIRCNNKQMFLRQHEVKMLLIKSFGEFQKRLGFRVYAFVIMDNHAHWLMQVQSVNGLSVVMQKVLLSFSRKYRQKNKYVGHFWQGRFRSVSVTTDVGMREVLKYVHENPLEAKIVSRMEDYPYSSVYRYSGFENEKMKDLIELTVYGDTSSGSVELIKL